MSEFSSKPKLVLITWLILLLSFVPYFMINQQGLLAINNWFMPVNGRELLSLDHFWQIWTPIFIHYTPLHLLTNVYLWWYFASKIENHNRLELLLLLVLIGGAANIGQWLVTGPKFGGLSGLAYGLMGYLWLLDHFAKQKKYHLDNKLVLLMLLMIPLGATQWFGKFADFAHISGLAIGCFLACVLIIRKKILNTNSWNNNDNT